MAELGLVCLSHLPNQPVLELAGLGRVVRVGGVQLDGQVPYHRLYVQLTWSLEIFTLKKVILLL